MAADRPEATPVCTCAPTTGTDYEPHDPGCPMSSRTAEATPVPDRHAAGIEAAAKARFLAAYPSGSRAGALAMWDEVDPTIRRYHVEDAERDIDAYLSVTGLVPLGAVVEALREQERELVDAGLRHEAAMVSITAENLVERFGSGEGTDHDE